MVPQLGDVHEEEHRGQHDHIEQRVKSPPFKDHEEEGWQGDPRRDTEVGVKIPDRAAEGTGSRLDLRNEDETLLPPRLSVDGLHHQNHQKSD